MHKAILLTILALISSSAMAEWVMIGENKILAITAYADPDTDKPQKNGHKVKMWKIYDYKTTQEESGYKFISAKFQNEYDCRKEQSRILVNTVYADNMGRGKVIFTEPTLGKWLPITSGSLDEALLKFACGKR